MRVVIFKLKSTLILSTLIMILSLIFMDSSVLNALVLNDNSFNNLVIEEIAYTTTPAVENNLVVNNQEMVDNYATNLNVAYSDYWAWPTESNYIITSYYGARWGTTHKAIDISGTGHGSNIYAANNGVVVEARGGCVTGHLSCNGRGGNYIVINHNNNNYYTMYMHLHSINVRVGDTVSRGQVIGTMGNTGNVVPRPQNSSSTSGTHLHFALFIGEPYKGGYAVNPMRLY